MNNLSDIRMHTPGPGNIPWFVRLASISQIAHHRDSFFKEIYSELQSNLQCIFKTSDPVLIMTCSGTGVMESVVKNIVNADDSVLVIDTGKYSHRWADILKISNIKVSVIKSNVEGSLVPYINIETALSNVYPRFVFVSHTETSTGVTYDLQRLSQLCKKKGSKLVVDAMATVGVQPLYKDEWDIDVVI
ncbi:alanine--glyoxylate aminotransferase family protein, partial [Salmonella enterica]|nr:alanine--glyoxylate aminotransferase family protein [Salmonella enterica]